MKVFIDTNVFFRGADCIVTRNVKDFAFSEIEVLTPSDFLAKYFPK